MMGSALELVHAGFAYPAIAGQHGRVPVLDDISLRIPEGSFCLLAGDTGAGKTTLLRLAKPELAPRGERTGEVCIFGRRAEELSSAESAAGIGYLFQDPENQIVCDTVWHELAFGLENLGIPQEEMRQRVAETCYFFGIEPWFRRRTSELSGGQKQVLALASLLAMRPRLLLLDEPASMLDPVAEKAFLGLLFRLNRELKITIVVASHEPKPLVPYADLAYILHPAGGAVPQIEEVPPQSLAGEPEGAPFARAGRKAAQGPAFLELRGVYQRYGLHAPWVLRDLSFSVQEGEIAALVGGNGSGKSTALSAIAGIRPIQHGKIRNEGSKLQAFLPQNPRALFSKETLAEELLEWGPAAGYGMDEVQKMLEELGLASDGQFLAQHPYDLSGGQQQLAAAAKLLLTRPKLLLLDEPTKGLDGRARCLLEKALLKAADGDATIVVATHDERLIREAADTVTLLFDGGAAMSVPADEFLAHTWLWGRR